MRKNVKKQDCIIVTKYVINYEGIAVWNEILKETVTYIRGPYYHLFNRLSFIIVALLPTKANHLLLVIRMLAQHRI